MKQEKEKNMPYAHLRAGAISCTIWKNEKVFDGKKAVFYNFSFQRGYKNDRGEWENTQNFQLDDLPKLAIIAETAFKKCAMGVEDIE